MREWLHLAGRFFGSLRPGGPSSAESAWAESILLDHERRMWAQMSAPDRRHAVRAAARAAELLGDRATRPVLAAALLHDVGKVVAGLGTWGRVVATLAGRAAGRDRARDWQRRGGFARRVGLYLRHDAIGAALLERGGSDPLTVAWAREHHRPAAEWSVDPELGEVLAAIDDD